MSPAKRRQLVLLTEHCENTMGFSLLFSKVGRFLNQSFPFNEKSQIYSILEFKELVLLVWRPYAAYTQKHLFTAREDTPFRVFLECISYSVTRAKQNSENPNFGNQQKKCTRNVMFCWSQFEDFNVLEIKFGDNPTHCQKHSVLIFTVVGRGLFPLFLNSVRGFSPLSGPRISIIWFGWSPSLRFLVSVCRAPQTKIWIWAPRNTLLLDSNVIMSVIMYTY